jgi:hypothetical protein
MNQSSQKFYGLNRHEFTSSACGLILNASALLLGWPGRQMTVAQQQDNRHPLMRTPGVTTSSFMSAATTTVPILCAEYTTVAADAYRSPVLEIGDSPSNVRAQGWIQQTRRLITSLLSPMNMSRCKKSGQGLLVNC